MSANKNKFEMEYFKKLGLDLYALNDKLVSRRVEIYNQNRNKHTREKAGDKHAELAIKALTTLRSELEELMFHEYPGEASIYVFYPGPEGNQSEDKSSVSGKESRKGQ
jgi:hypothetical protein